MQFVDGEVGRSSDGESEVPVKAGEVQATRGSRLLQFEQLGIGEMEAPGEADGWTCRLETGE